MLTFALPTGRLLDECVELLEAAGFSVEKLKKPGRNLVIEEGNISWLLSKPTDIPALVHYGAADLALVGSDVTGEAGVELMELLDTGKGRCAMCIAGFEAMKERFAGAEADLMGLRVATKYLRTTEKFFASRGAQVRIFHLHGSVELAPALHLSDCILDIVQTGGTLKANGLVIIEEIMPVSLRLVSSFAASQLRWEEIVRVSDALRAVCQ